MNWPTTHFAKRKLPGCEVELGNLIKNSQKDVTSCSTLGTFICGRIIKERVFTHFIKR